MSWMEYLAVFIESIPLVLVLAISALIAACAFMVSTYQVRLNRKQIQLNTQQASDALEEAKSARRISVTGMQIQSDSEYGDLMDELEQLGEWARAPENKGKIDAFRNLKASGDWKKVLDENYVPNEIWRSARPVKFFFLARWKSFRSGRIEKDLFEEMVNYHGLELLYEVVEPLARHRFFWIRRNAEPTEEKLQEDIGWYAEMQCIKPKYTG